MLRRWLFILLSILIGFLIIFYIVVDNYVEPILRDRLHTLIIKGSDSLYTYTLGKLKTNFFNGNVEVENLQISLDSNRYEYLRQRNSLPPLTMDFSLRKGYIKGVGIFSLLFGKKIRVDEIMSKDADVKLSRHIRKNSEVQEREPVWKAIRPKIESIYIGKIKLEGIKLLYKNSDTSEAVKLKFERCDALFKDIRIDSASAVDSSRIGFTKSIKLRFNDLKFRTEDSLYKMKAQEISFSSDDRSLEVDSFKLQTTIEKEDVYKRLAHQASLYYIEFNKVHLVNVRLDHFIYNNTIDPDSILFESPDIDIYNDRSYPLNYQSKVGKYPQQELLKIPSTIIIKAIRFNKGKIIYTEKNPKTSGEGVITIDDLDLLARNVTNDSVKIKHDPEMYAQATARLFGISPIAANFTFYLDSLNGRYDANGNIRNVTFSQLNGLSIPLANVQINSLNLNDLEFSVKAGDYDAIGNIKMHYRDLALTLNKTDEETGETKKRKFVTKVLNKYVIRPSNPAPDGTDKMATNVKVARLTTEAFFGLLWKTIFAGMEQIMMKTGH